MHCCSISVGFIQLLQYLSQHARTSFLLSIHSSALARHDFAFSLQILSFLVALCLLGITGLSATAILRSKEDYWTAFDSNGQKPAFKFQ